MEFNPTSRPLSAWPLPKCLDGNKTVLPLAKQLRKIFDGIVLGCGVFAYKLLRYVCSSNSPILTFRAPQAPCLMKPMLKQAHYQPLKDLVVQIPEAIHWYNYIPSLPVSRAEVAYTCDLALIPPLCCVCAGGDDRARVPVR